MKNIFFAFIVASGIALQLIPGSLSGQANLQFNQVLLITNTVQTVPTGRVWKIEAFTQNSSTLLSTNWGCGDINFYHNFFINGLRYSFPYIVSNAVAGNVLSAGTNFPFWIPAGTTLRTDCPGDLLSVIEFVVAL